VEPKKRWSDLTNRQRVAIVAAASVEFVLTTVALVDLSRRPSAQVRGVKPLWVLGCFLQPLGPLAYLAFGRRRSSCSR
jgi:hypothetical protein